MTRAVAAADAAREQRAVAAKGKHAIAAHDARAQTLAEQRKLARAAAEWAVENKCGSKKACMQQQFVGKVTYNMVERLRKKLATTGSLHVVRDRANQILTNDERLQLTAWLLACAAGQVSCRERCIIFYPFTRYGYPLYLIRSRHGSFPFLL